MGRIKFGSSTQQVTPLQEAKIEQILLDNAEELAQAYKEDSEAPLATMLPPIVEYKEVEKIVYVDKPVLVEVEKQVEVVKYVDKEVIVEKPVEIIKTVEVPVETIKYVDREVVKEVTVENQVNLLMVWAIAALVIANIIGWLA